MIDHQTTLMAIAALVVSFGACGMALGALWHVAKWGEPTQAEPSTHNTWVTYNAADQAELGRAKAIAEALEAPAHGGPLTTPEVLGVLEAQLRQEGEAN